MTIDIIKRLMENEIVARWGSAKPTHRSRRNAIVEMFGIHLDLDGVLIENIEKNMDHIHLHPVLRLKIM